MTLSPILLIAIIGAVSACSQWLAWKLKLPSILFLLLAGILVGPVAGVLDPDQLFGDLLFPFISIAVAIILFEGGLTLDLQQIRGHGSVVRNLLVIGVLITWLCMSLTVHWLFGFDWRLAFLFGAITVVTGPTVIKPLLRTVRPTKKIGSVLHWEGILIDPIGAFLAILVFEYILLSSNGELPLQVAIVLLKLIVVGAVTGVIFGHGMSVAISRYLVPDYLREVLTLIAVLVAFAIAETIQHESGLLTVTVMGAWLANSRQTRIEEIINFKENLSILLISALFILLAARLELDSIISLGWPVVLFLVIVQFVIRPLSMGLSTIGARWTWQERALASWIAPRGIVAAAISSLFVIRLDGVDIEQSELLVPLTFVLIIGTVVIQSLTTKPLGDHLGVTNPAPNGLLLVGSNPVSLALAKALDNEKVPILVADQSWRRISLARLAGISTYYGNPTSGHAEQHLDLSGIGGALAVTRSPERNALSVVHFRGYFGSDRVFVLSQASSEHEKEEESVELAESISLFGEDISYYWLRQKFDAGVEITCRLIEDDHTFDAEAESVVPLFAIDPDGYTHVYNSHKQIEPIEGWKVLYLPS